jgi:hypothetical protein
MAIYANLTVDQGSDFSSVVTVTDSDDQLVDLTNYTYRGQIRKSYTSSTAINFVITANTPANGELTITLTSSQTAVMKSGRYVYDVEIESGNVVTRVVEGQLEVTPRVTRTS